jgi:quinol monooxygenase YgiN
MAGGSTVVEIRRATGPPVKVGLMDAVQIDWRVTPFRADRFLELYDPAVARVMTYGAKGFLFYRSEADAQHFVHISLWEDHADFDRFWFSREMQEVRKNIAGLYEQPVLPEWYTVLERA